MIMRARLSYGFLAAGFVLSLAAAGCGDDDTGGGTGGTGGSATAGKGGGGAGKGGTGGAGKGGTGGTSGGAAPTVMECVTKTSAANGMSTSAACNTCACTEDAKSMVACDTNCWKLIACVNTKCTGAMDLACITKNDATGCGAELAATGNQGAAATPVGKILTGTNCGAKCSPGDSGAPDAGN
jgi:hypothetical protein